MVMTTNFLVRLCRSYQAIFPANHPDEAALNALHRPETMGAYLAEYVRHEMDKGRQVIERFSRMRPDLDIRDKTVLDFGCGGGGITMVLADAAQEVWGIDMDTDKIDFARQEADRTGRTNANFVAYDGHRLPFEDGHFDIIFTVDVAEHVADLPASLREIARVLRPGGTLLLSFGPPWKHAHGKHLWSKLPGWWTHLIFPRNVVMRTLGRDPATTWGELGLYRLTVARFERAIRDSGLIAETIEVNSPRMARPLRYIPWVREFIASGVVGVWHKPIRP